MVPGLAHSSPVIWKEKLFVTTAISSRKDVSFRHGLYGDGNASDDRSHHRWCVYCLDRKTGKILWERTATAGIPQDKRHIKSTYANSTPATDGRYIAALFGSEGLFVYDLAGNLIWKKDLGKIDCGAYDKPEYEWGPASSPIIYRGYLNVLQNNGNFDCYELKTGKEIYRERLPHAGSGFSASPVAADGKIYLPGEDGDIFVVNSGPEFKLIATNRSTTNHSPLTNKTRKLI